MLWNKSLIVLTVATNPLVQDSFIKLPFGSFFFAAQLQDSGE
jgi:hypothetical protein